MTRILKFLKSRFSCLSCISLFLAFSACPASSFAASSVNVPLDSWVYGALDKLEASQFIDTAVSGTKPYSRLETARLVKEAMEKWDNLLTRKKPSGFLEKELIPSLLERFKKEFKPELIEWGVLEGPQASTYLKPVDELILKYVHQTDDQIKRPQVGNPPTQNIYPIFNNDGIVYRKHNNFSAELEGEGRLWNHISLYYRPIFTAFEQEETRFDLEKGYLKAEGLNIELEVGRDSLWWGSGSNALLMTNNALPFDLIKIANQKPFLLPLVGLFKFNIFLSKLDYDRPSIPHPLLYGLRLDFKPHPLFEIGFSQIAIFSGEGRKALGFEDYFKILYGNRNYSGKLESNQQVSIDFSFRWPNLDKFLPIARSLKFYGEYGAEDTGFLPDRRAYLLGLYLNDLLLTGRVDLRLEYANTSPESIFNAWYTHSEYPPIYHERIFGHNVGSNAQDIFARLTAYLSPRILLGLDFNAQTQGLREVAKTESYQGGIDLDYLIWKDMSIKGRYILEEFNDPDSIAGGNATHHLFGIEFRCRF